MPIKVFFCYARKDELLLNELKSHLRPLQWEGLIDMWHDRNISAGKEWAEEINKHLNTSQIILLLVSSDFMDSDYCYSIEMKRALERHERRESHVIPVILRPVDWQSSPMSKLQVLPKDGKPITDWRSHDKAFTDIAREIRKVVNELLSQQPESEQPYVDVNDSFTHVSKTSMSEQLGSPGDLRRDNKYHGITSSHQKATIIFLFGLPGSGKSAIGRHIAKYVMHEDEHRTDRPWSTYRFNDNPILHTMFRDDEEHKRFVPAEPSGFNVTDISTYDEALRLLGNWIKWHTTSEHSRREEIVLIEFARNDYLRAFKQFSKAFLQDAYFIYLDTKVEICKQRIRDRVTNPEFEADGHPVSDYILEKYYYRVDVQALSSILHNVFGVDEKRMLMLNNNFSLKEVVMEIEPFIDFIIHSSSSRNEIIDTFHDYQIAGYSVP